MRENPLCSHAVVAGTADESRRRHHQSPSRYSGNTITTVTNRNTSGLHPVSSRSHQLSTTGLVSRTSSSVPTTVTGKVSQSKTYTVPAHTSPCKSYSVADNINSSKTSCDDSDENDWDLGIGKLVIDLDVDTNKAPSTSPNKSPSKMSSGGGIEHQATFDNNKGLKMKIKRKNPAGKYSDVPKHDKHEIVKGEPKNSASSSAASGVHNTTGPNAAFMNMTSSPPLEKLKHAFLLDKDKMGKGRALPKKDRTKEKCKPMDYLVSNGTPHNTTSSGVSSLCSTVTSSAVPISHSSLCGPGYSASEHGRNLSGVTIKKEAPVPDPYEFNAKVEDCILPVSKKIKIEKVEPCTTGFSQQDSSIHSVPHPYPGASGAACERRDVGIETCHVGVTTDPDCLGPCEPGTNVLLEGIVWQETMNGLLVVNVTWRGKTYVGTLMDATQHDWAPPRLNCDSPSSDVETKTPKGRGKRGRTAATVVTPKTETPIERRLRSRKGTNGTTPFVPPPSPIKTEPSQTNCGKRKSRTQEKETEEEEVATVAKRCRSSSRSTSNASDRESPVLIECPEHGCNKKYRHINGLKYHQSHAHPTGLDNAPDREICQGKESPRDSSASLAGSKPVQVKEEKDADHGQEKQHSSGSKLQNKPKRPTQPEKDTNPADPVADSNASNETSSNQEKSCKDDASKPSGDSASSSCAGNTTSQNSPSNGSKAKKDVDGKKVKQFKIQLTQVRVDGSKTVVPPGQLAVSTSQGTKHSQISANTSGHLTVSSSHVAVTSGHVSLSSTPQGYQISSASSACCLGTMTVPQSQPSAAQVMPSTGSSTLIMTSTPISRGSLAVATTTALPVALTGGATVPTSQIKPDKDCDKHKTSTKGDKQIKVKPVTSRSVIPSSATQVPVSISRTSLTPVTTLTQLPTGGSSVSNLKPIQPKPTVMGEPNPLNPLNVLTDLKKKKKKLKELKADKPKEGSVPPVDQKVSTITELPQRGEVSTHRPEAATVIKAVPSPLKASSELPVNVSMQNKPPVLEKQTNLPSSRPTENQTPQNRSSQPPSSLNLSSPLQVSTDTREQSGDVQSPAYSDISDANDSAPTLENESEMVGGSKDHPPHAINSNPDRPPSHTLSQNFDMYHQYYGQPPSLTPAISAAAQQSQQNSPVQPQQQAQQQQQQPVMQASPKQVEREPENNKTEKPQQKEQHRERPASVERSVVMQGQKPGLKDPAVVKGTPPPQQMSEQKGQSEQRPPSSGPNSQYVTQQYYMNLCGYGVDPNYPNYHMQMMANSPQYRAQRDKYAKEQEQRRHEQVDQQRRQADTRKEPETKLAQRKLQEASTSAKPKEKPHSEARPVHSKPPALVSDKEREELRRKELEKTDLSLREKQNENRQILKESIELKNQMEMRGQLDLRGQMDLRGQIDLRGKLENYDNNMLSERQYEELQRYYLYQHQKMMHQRYVDDHRRPGNSDPPRMPTETVSAPPRESRHSPVHRETPQKPRTEPVIKDKPAAESDSSRKESDSKQPINLKCKEDIRPSPQTTPKLKEVGSPMVTVPVTGPGPYTQYYPQAYYQSHYAGQMPFDPNSSAMYPGINPVIGYAGPAAYIHPAQMRYPGPPLDTPDKEKPMIMSPGGLPTEGKALEMLQQHASHYYNGTAQHKIHELKEAAKQRDTSSTSPVKEAEKTATKPGSGEAGSPPMQRHVHEHHHTHVVGSSYPVYGYGGLR